MFGNERKGQFITSEEQSPLNTGLQKLPSLLKRVNHHKMSVVLGALGIASGLSVAYDTFVKHPGNLSLDNYLNLNHAEANTVHDPVIDSTAPTFIPESIKVHINPDNTGIDPVYIQNSRFIGVFVGFPDQTQGIADLQAGKYNTAFLNHATIVNEFYDHFLGINVALETRPYIIMNHPYAYYDSESGHSRPDKLLQEALNRNLLTERYDGNSYPIYAFLDALDPNTLGKMGGSATIYRDSSGLFGTIAMPGSMLFNGAYNNYNLKKVLLHETGHTFGLPHNTNIKSVMNPDSYSDQQLSQLMDQSDASPLTGLQIGMNKNYLTIILRSTN